MFDAEDFYQLFKSATLCYLLITAATFMSRSMDYSRLIITNTFIISLFLITLSRSLLKYLLAGVRSRGFDRQKVVILGKTDVGESILERIKMHPELGYDFAGFFEYTRNLAGELREKDIKTVFVARSDLDQEDLIELITECESVEFKIVPDLVKLISEPLSFDEFRDIPFITVRKQGSAFAYPHFFKRFFDVLVSIVCLLLFPPNA